MPYKFATWVFGTDAALSSGVASTAENTKGWLAKLSRAETLASPQKDSVQALGAAPEPDPGAKTPVSNERRAAPAAGTPRERSFGAGVRALLFWRR